MSRLLSSIAMPKASAMLATGRADAPTVPYNPQTYRKPDPSDLRIRYKDAIAVHLRPSTDLNHHSPVAHVPRAAPNAISPSAYPQHARAERHWTMTPACESIAAKAKTALRLRLLDPWTS